MLRVSRALIALAILALVAPVASARAQQPGERAALDSLRDSLARATDSLSLRRLEGATIEIAKHSRDDPLIHLRLGVIAYRLGELGGKSHFDDAAGEFEWAAALRPDWPYPWFGDGLAELALGEHPVVGIENLRQVLRKDYLSKAARAFAKAAIADPAYAQATVELARTALAQRIAPRLDLALRAVREAAASPAGRTPVLQLARGRVERAVGDGDSALAAFRAVLALGGDSGVGLLEEARTQYVAQRPAAGARAYFAGARAGVTPAATALYREDLAWVASPGELAAFDSLGSAAARAAWLAAFWERRDAAEAREPGERLAEHYRRWFYAERNFRLVSRHRHYDITERYRAAQAELDDRGIVYMRHGPPDRRAAYAASDSVEPNESWLYHRAPPEGDLIFHFVARRGVQDYKLVESLADALTSGLGGALALQARGGLGPAASGLFASRSDFGPVYARLGGVLATSNLAGALSQEREAGRRSIAVGTSSDTYRRSYDMPLDVITSQFVVGDSSSVGTALHVVFAIPAHRLAPLPAGDRVVYPLVFRLLVSDGADRVVARLDTTRVFAAHAPLSAGSYLSGQLAVPLPPGRYTYRLLVEPSGEGEGKGRGGGAGSAGSLVTRDSVIVGTLTGGRFAVSDLVVGRGGSGLVWTDRGDTVFLDPLEQIPQGGTAELYYEVYGLPVGAPYHTVMRLEREGSRSLFGALLHLFGGARAPVVLGFDAPSDGPVTRVHRRLELRDVTRGQYVLSLRISDPATGVALTQRRRFTVVPR